MELMEAPREELVEGETAPRDSSPDPENSLKIYREVFDLCDKDGNGFITKPELSNICQQFSGEDSISLLDNVMKCLDSNHDGQISFDEFKTGFESFQRQTLEHSLSPGAISSSTPHKTNLEEVYESDPVTNEEEGNWREVLDRVDPQGTLAVTGVGAVWKELHQKDPSLLENFESFLTDVVSELRQSEVEKDTLQNHVRRIQYQHSREVSEMDNLLQEELQLAKVNHLQTNANQTSRLSSHYSSLLADREAVIDELSTNENDLKEALHHKAISESHLREEKNFLLSANKVLQKQLDRHSESGSAYETPSPITNINGDPSEEDEDNPTQPNVDYNNIEPSNSGMEQGQDEIEPTYSGMEQGQDEIEPTYSGMEQGQAISKEMEFHSGMEQDSTLHLKVINEVQDNEEDEIKYYPPKKAPRHDLSSEDDSKHMESDETTLPGQHLTDHSHKGVWSSSSQSSQAIGSSGGHKTGSFLGGVSRPYGIGASTDTPLTISGVMPRRDDMPRPPSPLAASRVFKVIFLGDSGVGKSSLISFLTEGEFHTNVVSTVGLDYSIKTLRVGEERVLFQLWDTAGQERFSNVLTPVYFRRADAFVIVYDVTDVRTFKSTKKWISVVKAALREHPPVLMLVGNKCDKTQQRCVAMEDGRKLALELQSLFSETSALSGDNVLQAHSTLAQLLLTRENAELQEIRDRAIKISPATQKSMCSSSC